MKLWDQQLPPTENSLYILHFGWDNPSKSGHQIFYEQHNFNAQPRAPPGCKANIHEHTLSPTSWGLRGYNLWYTGLAKDYCQYYHMYIIDTTKLYICKGVTFLSKFCTTPKIQPLDYTKQIPGKLLIKVINSTKETQSISKHWNNLARPSKTQSIQEL